MPLSLEIKKALVPSLKEKEKGKAKATLIRNLISVMEKTAIQEGVGGLENLTDLAVQRIVVKEIDAVKMEKQSILDVIESGKATVENEARYKERLIFLNKQLETLEEYAPKYMSSEELTDYIKAKVIELNIELPQGKGKFIGVLSKELKGKADMKLVNQIVSTI